MLADNIPQTETERRPMQKTMLNPNPTNFTRAVIYVCVALCLPLCVGCAITTPAPAPAGPLAAGVPLPGVPQVAHAPPAPAPRMNLPQFLGLDCVVIATATAARKTRLHLSKRWPVLQPAAKHETKPVGDPANLKHPSPTVAGAAKVQQAKASAPAKVQALAYLATLDCGSHPQVEEAYLAAMDDIVADVRAAAIDAIIASAESCGSCEGCTSCCTIPIRCKLTKIAYEKNDVGCYVEPVSKVRRLARIALEQCGGPAVLPPPPTPEELPNPAIVEMIQAPKK